MLANFCMNGMCNGGVWVENKQITVTITITIFTYYMDDPINAHKTLIYIFKN